MIEIVLLKVTLLLALTWTLTHALRGRSAATRHFVWCLGLFGSMAIAVVELTAPPVRVVMPAPRETVAPVTVPVVDAGLVATPPAPPEARAEAHATFGTLPAIWMGGVILVLAWSAIGHVILARIARRATPADGFRFSDDVSAPVTWGNVILMPVEARDWPEERLRAALLHERAHIARADFLTQAVAQLVAALYWFHPLVWLAMKRLRAESEHACDDRVLAGGMTAPEYASHLLAVAHGALARRHATAGVAMARPSQFESRLVAVLDETRSRGLVSRRTAAAASILVAIVLVPFVVARAEARKQKTSDRPASVVNHTVRAASGETLTLDLETGSSIEVTPWDEPRVNVTVFFRDDDAEETNVHVGRDANGVLIRSRHNEHVQVQSTSLRMQIRTPRRFNMDLQSAGGDVILTGLEGTFRGTTGGGQILLDKMKGTADLTTGGGEVHVTDSHLDGDVTTGGGGVRIERTTGSISGSSGTGPVSKTDKRGRASISRSGGDVVLSEAVDQSVSTGGGDIHIARGSGYVAASTGGGNVRLERMAGSVVATTGGGDIEVTMESTGGEQNVDISTGSGKVIVELPADFDARLDLETAYTASYGRVAEIESDWSVQRESPPEWDSTRGTPRRIVRARGTVGSGRGLVRVRAINGDVIVRRK